MNMKTVAAILLATACFILFVIGYHAFAPMGPRKPLDPPDIIGTVALSSLIGLCITLILGSKR